MSESTSSVQPIPEGVPTVVPHLIVRDAEAAIAYYREVFGAEEGDRMHSPDGRVMHASLRFGDAMIFVADDYPEFADGASSAPDPDRRTAPVSVHLYVEDVNAVYARAVERGARVLMPLDDQFWGDRFGCVMDPFGHAWELATHVREVSEEEMRQAAAAMA